jgi:hypothetical protein
MTKRVTYFFRLQWLLVSAVFLLFSCEMSPDVEEVRSLKAEKIGGEASQALIGPVGPIIGFPISFHRVDLFTVTSNNVSGTVTVEIRNADGSVVLGSTTVPGSSILKGNSIKNTFTFSPALTLTSGQKYRIYITRSNQHNYMNDHIAWRTCSGGVDGYPKGVMNYSPNWLLDYSFITFSDGNVDQQQTATNYGFAFSNTGYLWQEFVPSKIWIVAQ